MSTVRGRRPIATSTASPSTASPSERWTFTTFSPETASAFTPSLTSTPDSRSPSATSIARELLQVRHQRRLRLHQDGARAERRVGLRQLGAHRAAAEHEQALRAPRSDVVASRLVHGPTSASPSIGGTAASVPVATTTAFRAISSCSPAQTRRSPSSLPSPRNSSMPCFSSQGSWPESSRSVDHLVAARQRRSDVDLAGDRLGGAGDAPDLGEGLGRAQQRLRRHAGVVGALAADQVALDDRDLESRRRRGARRRPRPETRPRSRRRRTPGRSPRQLRS